MERTKVNQTKKLNDVARFVIRRREWILFLPNVGALEEQHHFQLETFFECNAFVVIIHRIYKGEKKFAIVINIFATIFTIVYL